MSDETHIISTNTDETKLLIGQSEGEDSLSKFSFESLQNLSKFIKESYSAQESSILEKAIKEKEQNVSEPKESTRTIDLGEGTMINSWKLVESMSARIVEKNEEIIVLECLVDKLSWYYELREFASTDFEDFETPIGKLFKLELFRRPKGQFLMIIKDDVRLINEDDFPKNEFEKKLSKIKFRK